MAVSEWLQKDGLKEFEDEFFNEEKLNKAIECYHNDDNSILETTEEEVEDEASRDTMTIRRAVREWAKIERELEFLQRPHFVGLEAVVRLRAEHAALAPAMRERNEFAEVRKIIVSRGAARRFSRVRAAFSCSDAASVLRHYAGLHEDAEYLRAQYPANTAALMFADRTEGLAALVEEKKGDLEKQREADKAAVLSGVKQTTREVKETQVKENLAWKQTKGEADGLNERHKQLKGNENE